MKCMSQNMSHFVAFHLGLHCLPNEMYSLLVSCLKMESNDYLVIFVG